MFRHRRNYKECQQRNRGNEPQSGSKNAEHSGCKDHHIAPELVKYGPQRTIESRIRIARKYGWKRHSEEKYGRAQGTEAEVGEEVGDARRREAYDDSGKNNDSGITGRNSQQPLDGEVQSRWFLQPALHDEISAEEKESVHAQGAKVNS